MSDNPKVNANRAQWTDRGLCPNPTCCVGHRGDCGRIECARRPHNYQPQAQPVCACRISDNGRGVAPCVYHAEIIDEHQRMYHALDAIANGAPLGTDVGAFAAEMRATVKYRHAE